MILDEMNQAGNRMNVVILDACRSNPFQRGFKSVRQGLAQMNPPEDKQILIAYATASNSVAADGSRRNSPYTENLLKYMVKPGLKVDDVFKKVRSGVINDTNNQQFPWIAGSFSDDFYFTTDKPSESASVQTPAASAYRKKPKYRLRSEPMRVSYDEYRRVLDKNNRFKEYIDNNFKDNLDETISDHATGIMWQKSGSDKYLTYEDVKIYIDELNRKRFAGYNDWRLPTMDELKSLLTLEKQPNALYINPIFDKMQRWCWTSDFHTSDRAWSIFFDFALIYLQEFKYDKYIRSVRSVSP